MATTQTGSTESQYIRVSHILPGVRVGDQTTIDNENEVVFNQIIDAVCVKLPYQAGPWPVLTEEFRMIPWMHADGTGATVDEEVRNGMHLALNEAQDPNNQSLAQHPNAKVVNVAIAWMPAGWENVLRHGYVHDSCPSWSDLYDRLREVFHSVYCVVEHNGPAPFGMWDIPKGRLPLKDPYQTKDVFYFRMTDPSLMDFPRQRAAAGLPM